MPFLLLAASQIHIFKVLLVLLILFHHLLYYLDAHPLLWCLLIKNVFKGVWWWIVKVFVCSPSFRRSLPKFKTLTLVHSLEYIWRFCELYGGSGDLPALCLLDRLKVRLGSLTYWVLIRILLQAISHNHHLSSLVLFLLGEQCVWKKSACWVAFLWRRRFDNNIIIFFLWIQCVSLCLVLSIELIFQ